MMLHKIVHLNKSWLLLLPLMVMLSACGDGEREDLKSPCVGLEESPCGPKRSVNSWWMA